MPRLALICGAALVLPSALSQEPADPDRPASLVDATRRFEMHSHAWVGLHHFLYEWARSETEVSTYDTRPRAEVPEKRVLEQLDESQREEWQAAWRFYLNEVLPRPLTFDDDLQAIKTVLCTIDSEADDLTDEQHAGLGDHALVLSSVMPIYRERFWPAHDAANRAWIAEQVPLLEQHEVRLIDGLLAAFDGRWPGAPLRVDVSAHTNWAGAYTTNDPNHIMVSSSDPDIRGLHGLEMIVHESSHAKEIEGDHIEALEAAYAQLGAEPPERLWHALIFYTSGELMKDAFAEADVEFEPYAERAGFYDRRSWAGYREAFDAHWRPLLSGEIEREAAYLGVARALSSLR